MLTPHDLILLKVERAKKHIAELDDALKRFFNPKPYEVATKRDPKTRELIYYLVKADPVPPTIAAIAGDVLQNLRTALDHTAYHLFRVSVGPTGGDGKHIYFPISDSAAKYKTEQPGKVKGMRKEFIDVIDRLTPYRPDPTAPHVGGNETLWMLHRLNNIDKHRLLVTVWSALEAHEITPAIRAQLEARFPDKLLELRQVAFMNVSPLVPLKQGDPLFTDVPDAEVNPNLQFIINVAFGEPAISQRQTLLDTLYKMHKMVLEIIEGFGAWLG
jgi:hypothetical protein